jgi:hypothetical protein
MAIKKLPYSPPGHSRTMKPGVSNLPIQSPANHLPIGFGSGATFGPPEIRASEIDANDLRPASTPPPSLNQPPSAPPAALNVPRNGCTPNDDFRVGNC